MDDFGARRDLGGRALACARQHFSPEACFRDLIAAVGARAASTAPTAEGVQNTLRETASASQ
jgi:hypothetical protein